MRPRLFLCTPLAILTQEGCERAGRGGAAAAIPQAPGWPSRSWATGKTRVAGREDALLQ